MKLNQQDVTQTIKYSWTPNVNLIADVKRHTLQSYRASMTKKMVRYCPKKKIGEKHISIVGNMAIAYTCLTPVLRKTSLMCGSKARS